MVIHWTCGMLAVRSRLELIGGTTSSRPTASSGWWTRWIDGGLFGTPMCCVSCGFDSFLLFADWKSVEPSSTTSLGRRSWRGQRCWSWRISRFVSSWNSHAEAANYVAIVVVVVVIAGSWRRLVVRGDFTSLGFGVSVQPCHCIAQFIS